MKGSLLCVVFVVEKQEQEGWGIHTSWDVYLASRLHALISFSHFIHSSLLHHQVYNACCPHTSCHECRGRQVFNHKMMSNELLSCHFIFSFTPSKEKRRRKNNKTPSQKTCGRHLSLEWSPSVACLLYLLNLFLYSSCSVQSLDPCYLTRNKSVLLKKKLSRVIYLKK